MEVNVNVDANVEIDGDVNVNLGGGIDAQGGVEVNVGGNVDVQPVEIHHAYPKVEVQTVQAPQAQVNLEVPTIKVDMNFSDPKMICGAELPVVSSGAAIASLILNILFPGLGTMIIGCMGTGSLRCCCWFWIGMAQSWLSSILFGWVWAIITSCRLMALASPGAVVVTSGVNVGITGCTAVNVGVSGCTAVNLNAGCGAVNVNAGVSGCGGVSGGVGVSVGVSA